jgi:hypothetical protein
LEYYLVYLIIAPACELGPKELFKDKTAAWYATTYTNCMQYAELEFKKKYTAKKGNG